jgi:hypothetical protein
MHRMLVVRPISLLERRLKCEFPVAYRLLDVSRTTQINEIAKALGVLGKRVVIDVANSP